MFFDDAKLFLKDGTAMLFDEEKADCMKIIHFTV